MGPCKPHSLQTSTRGPGQPWFSAAPSQGHHCRNGVLGSFGSTYKAPAGQIVAHTPEFSNAQGTRLTDPSVTELWLSMCARRSLVVAPHICPWNACVESSLPLTAFSKGTPPRLMLCEAHGVKAPSNAHPFLPPLSARDTHGDFAVANGFLHGASAVIGQATHVGALEARRIRRWSLRFTMDRH